MSPAASPAPPTQISGPRPRGDEPDFDQFTDRWNYFRSFNFSLNYKFGKLKDGIKKNKRGIRNDDVQNGGN